MSRLTIECIKKECVEKKLAFRRGKFKNGNKYRVSAFINSGKHVWPCRTLQECKEAITQAVFLKDTEFV